MNTIKFMITDTKYIEVIPEFIEKEMCKSCSCSNIYYVDQGLNLNILFGYTETECFHGVFPFKGYDAVLKNKLFFDSKMRKDLGFELNQYSAGLLEKSDVVDKYHFLDNNPAGVSPQYSSWFYNDEKGNIIFEISPTYAFFGKRKSKKNNFISYKEFMKNYKVAVRTIIPKKIFKQWGKQAKLYDPGCCDDSQI